MSKLRPNPPEAGLPGVPGPWRSVPALAERINAGAAHPTLTAHAIRHYLRNADRNGLAPHVRRLGRKLLVNETGFLDWISNQGMPR